tara:strand:+ start:365 stop:502 length:138 start_codon:yes stop_codon:yes gene_type:complete
MPVEETKNEARQGTTTNGTGRRVLFISLGLCLIILAGIVFFYIGG